MSTPIVNTFLSRFSCVFEASASKTQLNLENVVLSAHIYELLILNYTKIDVMRQRESMSKINWKHIKVDKKHCTFQPDEIFCRKCLIKSET